MSEDIFSRYAIKVGLKKFKERIVLGNITISSYKNFFVFSSVIRKIHYIHGIP